MCDSSRSLAERRKNAHPRQEPLAREGCDDAVDWSGFATLAWLGRQFRAAETPSVDGPGRQCRASRAEDPGS